MIMLDSRGARESGQYDDNEQRSPARGMPSRESPDIGDADIPF